MNTEALIELVSNPIIKLIAESVKTIGVNFSIHPDGYAVINGLFKSGEGQLKIEHGSVFLHQRYDRISEINSWDDLIYVYYHWWNSSKNRGYDGWVHPGNGLTDEFKRLGLVKTEVIEKVIPI